MSFAIWIKHNWESGWNENQPQQINHRHIFAYIYLKMSKNLFVQESKHFMVWSYHLICLNGSISW